METCPHLEYLRSDEENNFDTERAYCSITEQFVQPMRADICNNRGELSHESHCEIYRAQDEGE